MRKQPTATREPWSRRRLLGAKVFHNTRDPRMTPGRWLSCGVCHLDGGVVSDGLRWEFTDPQKHDSPKLLNTKDLTVTGWSAPPLLISGKYKTVQEEDKFIRSFLGGTGFIAHQNGSFPGDPVGKSPEMDAVAEYVLALRPRPNPHMKDGLPRMEIRASAVRGQEFFFSDHVGCSRCHSGPYFTQSGRTSRPRLTDVGTGMRGDIPSLRNLWQSAPYLHDGRAKTLQEVLTTYNSHDKHGKTRHLKPREVADLATFLLAPFEEKKP